MYTHITIKINLQKKKNGYNARINNNKTLYNVKLQAKDAIIKFRFQYNQFHKY